MANIVQGILISQAAEITENAFRDVLGMSDSQLANLSPDDKFSKYCDQGLLDGILVYVATDTAGGLPSMQPPRLIDASALSGIGLGSKIRLLIRRLSDFAFYFQTP